MWLLGSFAVLSLLYRAEVSAAPAAGAAEISAEQAPASAEVQPSGAEVLTKRAQAARIYAELSAGQLAAAGLSASYARALVAEFHAKPGRSPSQRPPARSRGHSNPEAGP